VQSSRASRVSVVLAGAHRLAQVRDLRLGHAVGREFVGVEDPARAAPFRVIGELGPEPPVGLDLPAEQAVEPMEGDGHDRPAVVDGAADHPTVGVLEDPGGVHGVAHGRVTFLQPLADLQKLRLAAHLQADDVVDVVELLDALEFDPRALLDGDVDVLADRPEAALDGAGRPEQHADALGGLACPLGRADVRPGPDLDQRDAQPVEAVPDPRLGLLDPLGGLLFEHEIHDRDRPLVSLDLAVAGDQRRALEPGRVRAVDDDLAHHLDRVNGIHVQQLGDLQAGIQSLRVEAPRRLVVLLDQAGGVVGEVGELPIDHGLLQRGLVDLAEFALRGVEVPRERPPRGFGLA